MIVNSGNPYERVSEQQVVDCGNSDVTGGDYYMFGCYGGMMHAVWDYQKDKGINRFYDYPYDSGMSGSEGSCRIKPFKKIATRPTDWGSIYGGPADIADKLMDGPLGLGLSANHTSWRFYSGGILDVYDCYGQVDHAVTLVGYDDGNGDDNEPVDPVDPVDPDEDDDEPVDPVDPDEDDDDDDMFITQTTCRRQRWKDKFYVSGCRYTDEMFDGDLYCCYET